MNYRIKPLEWSENFTGTEWVASGARETIFMINKIDENTYKINTGISSTGRYNSLEKAKQANQVIHDNAVIDYINRWCEFSNVTDSKAFIVSQIGAVENLIKCAQEGGDLVAVVQLKQKLQKLEQELKGNGSEVMKAFAELRAALSEKDMAAIDEELKERGNENSNINALESIRKNRPLEWEENKGQNQADTTYKAIVLMNTHRTPKRYIVYVIDCDPMWRKWYLVVTFGKSFRLYAQYSTVDEAKKKAEEINNIVSQMSHVVNGEWIV